MLHSAQPLEPAQVRTLEERLRGVLVELDGIVVPVSELRDAVLDVVAARRVHAPDAADLDLIPPYLSDFCLAYACRRRPSIEGAWTLLIGRHSQRLARATQDWGTPIAEDCVPAFFGELWVERAGGRSLLDTYMGLGPLASWMALILRRQVARAAKENAAFVPLNNEPCTHAHDPEELVQRQEFELIVRPALDRLLSALPSRDREFFEARILRAEPGVDTARRFGVSPAYISRRFKEVRLSLRARLAPILERSALRPDEEA